MVSRRPDVFGNPLNLQRSTPQICYCFSNIKSSGGFAAARLGDGAALASLHRAASRMVRRLAVLRGDHILTNGGEPMNKARRKRLQRVLEKLQEQAAILSDLCEAENSALSNMEGTGNLETTERYQSIEQAAAQLDSAVAALDEAVQNIEEIDDLW
jgi:hypothetical protein